MNESRANMTFKTMADLITRTVPTHERHHTQVAEKKTVADRGFSIEGTSNN